MISNNITYKQQEILLLIYRFRFLNRLQIQTLLNHTTSKRINPWLKDLTEKGYIHRIFKRSWKEYTVPAKYYIGINGIRFLRTQKSCHREYIKKLYREKTRSQRFIDKSLFITDRYIQFLEKTKDTPLMYQFFTQQDFNPISIMKEINPHFVIAKGATKKKKYFAYELFEEGTPRFAIRYRIQQCIDFFQDEEHSLNINLTFICDDNLYKFVNRFVKRLLDEDESIMIKLSVKVKGEALFQKI